jgi:nicotinamide-nucleotide amidase
MDVEIIAIGDEILFGYHDNTNGSFISQMLLQNGHVPTKQQIVGDNPDHLKKALNEALQRDAIIITTGGLGPTIDDRTRQVVGELFAAPVTFRPDLEKQLQERFGPNLPTLKDQSCLPQGAHPFANALGSASGFALENPKLWGKSLLIALPGVPTEMKAMFCQQVLPFLAQRSQHEKSLYIETLHFVGLKEHEVDPSLRQLEQQWPQLLTGIYPSFATLTCHLKTSAYNKREASQYLQPAKAVLEEKFGEFLFAAASGQLEEALHALLIAKQLRLALAESCTGGALTASLITYPGASAYLQGTVVAYNNEIKQKCLHIDSALLASQGAVSPAVASQMAEQIRLLMNADCGIAISGILGPDGGTTQKPVGTICAAIALANRPTHAWTSQLQGNRTMILEKARREVLATLYLMLKTYSFNS